MRKKRGSTLTELVIVMAIVSVVSAMVVTFTVLVNGWVNVGTARYNLVQSERLVLDNLRIFSSRYDSSKYVFSCSEDGSRLDVHHAESGVHEGSFSFSSGVLNYKAGDVDLDEQLDHVVGIHFSILRGQSRENSLIICRISYSLPTVSSQTLLEKGSNTVSIALRAAKGEG